MIDDAQETLDQAKDKLSPLTQLLPQQARDFLEAGGWWLVFGVVALVLVWVFWALVSRLLRALWRALFGRSPPDLDARLLENLAEYPAPGPPGPRRLTVEGLPVRLRLVVAAPIGKGSALTAEQVEALLDQVVYGLGTVAQYDRPRVRAWPPRLSNAGFGPTFQRLARRPEPPGQASLWVHVAGQARVGTRMVLLGLAMLADDEVHIGRINLEPKHWPDVLRIYDRP